MQQSSESQQQKDVVTSEMMEDRNGLVVVMEQSEVDVEISQTKAQPQINNARHYWSNGQCVVAVPSLSLLNPSFDLSLCRAKLENDGFQIPVSDMEAPLNTALDVPSVRRYVVFNSALFHFILAPMLYVIVWCALFSTLHLYMTVSDYWVLCLSVSLVSIFLSTTIIFILHHSNKELNMNLDVRLIQVNERMVKHKLLVAVADWVQNCNGNMQLYFVYWDMSHCLRALTETLEERSSVANDTQKKMKKKMSHLVLTAEIKTVDPEVGGSDVEEEEEVVDEQRPLLRNEERNCIATIFSLVPDASIHQASYFVLFKWYWDAVRLKPTRLLMTYSAAYVKLLVSERLSGPTHHHPRSQRNHCTTAPFCLCQYIKKKVLR
ncbi:Transmembrane protein 268 [Collichthys lucidus]|uniref:Transmembrane protein 268 n=1 Tax=Collichthys lucidus TaxID=240159 RepID=A0A4U5VKM7_COLLU|nr:Transmembrane protein 268 [Collichthys lucidus]